MSQTPQAVREPAARPAPSDHVRQLVLRVAGGAMVLAGVVVLLVVTADVLGAFGDAEASYSLEGITTAAALRPESGGDVSGVFFLCIPLFLVGGVCLAVGLSGGRPRAIAAAEGGCRTCGTRPDPEARFCRTCGTAVP